MLTTIGQTSASVLLAATAKKTTSGSEILDFYIIFVVAVIGYMVFIRRPRQQRLRQHNATIREFEVGTEVLTAGGIVGTVIEIDGDRITLETSVGASFVVLRPYVLRRMDADETLPTSTSAPGLAGLFGGGRYPAKQATAVTDDEDVEEHEDESSESAEDDADHDADEEHGS